MSIVKIGLTVSLLLATGFAHSAVYNLGDITNSSKGGVVDYYNNYYDYEIYDYDTVTDTFNFSITEESRLSAFASLNSDFGDVSFSLIQLEEFAGEVTNFGLGFSSLSMAILNDVTAGDSVVLAAGNYALQLGVGTSAPYLDKYLYSYNITASSITSPVPEPSSIALMLGGLGLVGFMAARRKRA